MVWGFAPGCRDQFCQLKFWLVSEAKAALVAARAGPAMALASVCLHRPAAPLGMWVCVGVSRKRSSECYG